jgi:hypothetical protein
MRQPSRSNSNSEANELGLIACIALGPRSNVASKPAGDKRSIEDGWPRANHRYAILIWVPQTPLKA